MLKTRYVLFLFLFLLPLAALHAQVNLVPNPSFEADDNAPVITSFNWNHYGDWRTDSLNVDADNAAILAQHWFAASAGTPDYLNSDKSNLLGFKTKTARTGNGRMAIITGVCKNGLVSWMLYKDTYSEYIECKLNQPLESGKMYCVRYYVALDRKSNFCSNHFGATVTREKVSNPTSHTQMWGFDPQAHINAAEDHYITSDEGWVMICDTFIAKGGEQFLTLGSFTSEFPKQVHWVKKSQHGSLRVEPFNKFAYYYVDDVSLTEVKPGDALCEAPRDSVAKNNIVIMIDVSGSMVQKGFVNSAKNSILPLVNTLPPGDRITLIAFSDGPQVLADHIAAGDTASIRIALESMKTGGGTNPVSAFNIAYATIRKEMMPDGNNKIIMLTDGKIHLPKTEKEKIYAAAANEHILLSVIFFGDAVPDDMTKFVEAACGHASLTSDGDPEAALKKEIPAHVTDTPYGERNAGRIIAWEALTKILFPAILVLAVLKAGRQI